MESKMADNSTRRLAVLGWLLLTLLALTPLVWHTAVQAADPQQPPPAPERQVRTSGTVTTIPPRAITAVAPDWLAVGNQDGANFGMAVDIVGDYNGDNYDDLVIGAPLFDLSFQDQGLIELYLGNPGMSGPSLFQGITLSEEGANYGHAVSAAGDVNGDGFTDFLSSAPGANNGEGIVFIDYGTAITGTYQAIYAPAPEPDALFGFALAAGDVNGDGYDDVLIGAPGFPLQSGGNRRPGADGVEQVVLAGAAFLYYGGPTGISTTPGWILYSDLADAHLGYAVAIGDFNDDGFGDVAVGAPNYSLDYQEEGAVFVFYGSSGGALSGPIAEPVDSQWFFGGEGDFHLFGAALDAGGSVNGDGIDDLLVGAPGYSDANGIDIWGAVYGFLGDTQGLDWYAWFSSSYQTYSEYGTAVAILADTNGDGIDDILIGAPEGYPAPWPDGTMNAPGMAYLFLGNQVNLPYFPALVLSSNQANSRFGQSVAGGGDVNDDGYGDFFIGAPGYTSGNTTPGAVFGYFGSGPIAGLVASNSSPTPLGSLTFFSASVETGTMVDFVWSFGDGDFGVGAVVSHTYELPGLYTAVVTASNPINSLTATTPVIIKVGSTVDPINGGTLNYISPSGWGINVNVPAGAVTETVGLAFTPLNPTQLTQPLPPNPSTYFFDLDPVIIPPYALFFPFIAKANTTLEQGSSLGALLTHATAQVVTDDAEHFYFLVPITIGVTYTDAQIPSLNEDDLILTYWDGSAWVDAATTCPDPEPYIRDPQNNFFSLQVCHLSRFGMSGR